MYAAVYKPDDVIAAVEAEPFQLEPEYEWYDLGNWSGDAASIVGQKWNNGNFETRPPPPPPPPPRTISFRQFWQALANEGVITQEEALALVRTGTIPERMQQIVNMLPPNQQFDAKMLISAASEFDREHPLVAVFARAMAWTDQRVDELWRDAASL